MCELRILGFIDDASEDDEVYIPKPLSLGRKKNGSEKAKKKAFLMESTQAKEGARGTGNKENILRKH